MDVSQEPKRSSWLELRTNDQLTKGRVIASSGGIVDKALVVECQLCQKTWKKKICSKEQPRSKARALFPLGFDEGEGKFNGAPVSPNEKEEGGEGEGSVNKLRPFVPLVCSVRNKNQSKVYTLTVRWSR